MIAVGVAAVASLLAFAALGGVGVGQSAIGAAQYKAPKVTICHKASPNKWVTISISANAWPAHKRHGDVLGRCTQTAAQSNKGKGKGKGNGNKPTTGASGSSSSGQGRAGGNGNTPTVGSGNAGKGKGNGRK